MAEADTRATSVHRILVIDDEPYTATLARDWFRDQPFEILSASNGERGLALAVSENPDVILLDLTMPGMDGLTVAQRLKADPRTRAIQILLLTACRDVETKVKAFAAGAEDYVTKPCEFAEVAARIGSMLKRRDALVDLENRLHEASSSNQQLEQLLMVDDKTGLYNFREFQRRLREEWHRSERYDVPLSLVFLALDHFKQVNDTLGHQAGDGVLGEFAMLVAGGARASDIAARYGGEEFAIILPHTAGERAMRVAERIRHAVQEFAFLADSTPTRITVSAGVATMDPSSGIDSVDALVRTADVALYEAKDRGRNQVVQGRGRGRSPRAG